LKYLFLSLSLSLSLSLVIDPHPPSSPSSSGESRKECCPFVIISCMWYHPSKKVTHPVQYDSFFHLTLHEIRSGFSSR
jgi:hypothetical protein